MFASLFIAHAAHAFNSLDSVQHFHNLFVTAVAIFLMVSIVLKS